MRIGQHLRGWRLGVLAVILCGFVAGAMAGDDEDRGDWGAVFTLTNEPDGNELAVYLRDGHGRLAPPLFVPTGGLGTGGGLGNQGALALSDDKDFIYAVNPGSDTITVFRLSRRGPREIQVIASGGRRPISLTIHKDLLYVLNAGGAVGDDDSIAGFEIRNNGKLRPIARSVQLLSAANTAPAQIGFNNNGKVLVVTEKATNLIATFSVNRDGVPTGRRFQASEGATPFGFEFSRDGFLIVSEAFGGAPNASAVSSYWLDDDGIDPISSSVPTTETAACWIAVTHNGDFAFTTNTGSNTVSAYRISRKGRLKLLDADGIAAETGAAPTDATVLGNGALFVLNRNAGSVGVYLIDHDGSLAPLQLIGGLPLTNPHGLVVR